jgi:predicted alpha/beta-fold hydrolase
LDVVHRVVAVSVPLDLQTDAKQLDHGWNKLIYTRDFLRTLKPKVLKKIAAHGLDLNPRAIRATSTFRESDNLYTLPSIGLEMPTITGFARAAGPGFGTSKSRPF